GDGSGLGRRRDGRDRRRPRGEAGARDRAPVLCAHAVRLAQLAPPHRAAAPDGGVPALVGAAPADRRRAPYSLSRMIWSRIYAERRVPAPCAAFTMSERT